MELSERKNGLVEYNIARDVDTARSNIQTLKPFVLISIAKENALFGSKRKLTIIIGAEIGPTGTTKSAKKRIIRLNTRQLF